MHRIPVLESPRARGGARRRTVVPLLAALLTASLLPLLLRCAALPSDRSDGVRESPDLVVRFVRAAAPAGSVTAELELRGSDAGVTRLIRRERHLATVELGDPQARAADGSPLPLVVAPSAGAPAAAGSAGDVEWQVHHRAGERITLRYAVRRIDPEPASAGTRCTSVLQAGDDGAVLFSALLHAVVPRPLHWDDSASWNCRLDHAGFVEAGETACSSFGVASGACARLGWRDFGRALFLAGALELARLPVGTTELVVARQRGDWRFPFAELVDAAARLLVAERALFDDPGRPTTLLALVSDRGLEPLDVAIGGPIHWNLLLLLAPESVGLRYGNGNPELLHLLAHEWLHVWFGKETFVAEPRAPGDGDPGARWFHEGFTEHFANRVLYATGLVERAPFFRQLNERLAWQFTSPLAWISRAERARVERGHPEEAGFAYFEGELIAWAVDGELRAAGHSAGLAEWMRDLAIQARARPGGFGSERLLAELARFAGAPLAARVRAALESGEPLAPAAVTFEPDAELCWEERPLRDPPPGDARVVRVPQLRPR